MTRLTLSWLGRVLWWRGWGSEPVNRKILRNLFFSTSRIKCMLLSNPTDERIISSFKKSKESLKQKIKKMMSSNEDSSDMRCRFCQSNTIFMDYAQGDAVCTSCGVVNAERLPYCGAEWRDYSAINDDQDKKYVARAGSIVDETRWSGGLEPTSLGPVYGGYSREAERYRKSLSKIKRVVDNWTDKEFEKRVEESRLAIKIKKENISRVKGEYEEEEEEGGNEDWTQLGTNEHEHIARKRMDELETSHKMLISEKWSLDRALLLHGSSNEIPNRHHIFDETPRDIEEERETLLKRMDSSQRKASSDLYEIYSLTRCALGILGLVENIGFMSEAMDAIQKYAQLKGSFTVRGVSNKIHGAQNSKNIDDVDQQRVLNKLRQMGALVSAFIYLICKKNGHWRTLNEICNSIKHPNVASSNDAFIKAKHCSRAISDIRAIMPDYVQAVTIASAKPSLEVESESEQSRHVTVTTNMVGHALKNLNLSDIALAAVTNIAIHAEDYIISNDVKPSVLIAAITYLVCDAGSTMQRLASQAATTGSMNTMENASLPIDANKTDGNCKRKHIRPGGGGGANSHVKRRLDGITSHQALKVGSHETDSVEDNDTCKNDKNPTSVTPEPESFDALSQSIQKTPISASDYPPSWYEWNREKAWGRSMKEIETCCKVNSTAARTCYKTQIYPKRKDFLEMLQKSFPHNTTIGNCKVDIMLSNITVASSLMNSVPR
mmetsp:Transcript_9738/g.18286  ORF Transcript_9738/g.18286 Transcript_9738/m.18286 type:complete len:720 (-) Transcript_9738:1051-3210(-)